ncbi:uncharacterized protein LOC142986184 [Anticarsia gemmatalis]|uniref:uncharacterized protein LOC142986184 n=1 Tax=Anticarsia gemmatalis TaxID=129554 RepID=UPI003F774107
MSFKHLNFPTVLSTKSYLNVSLNKIENRLSELSMYLGKNSRQKRELLDGLSSVLKWLIGTPDAKDAKHYNEYIDLLEKQNLEMSELMQKQIQITSSTIKNFNETIFKISFDEQIINENIRRLNDYFNKTENLVFNLKITEDITSITIQILELATNLENDINDCLTSILFAKSNIIHPSIISLKKLYNELLLSNKLRTNKRLVTSVSIENIHTLLDSSYLSAYVFSDRLVYILEFPLVQNDPLTLYHIYSIPIQHPNSSFHSTIIPEHTYLATNPSGQRYVSTSLLNNCKVYASRKSICKDLVIYDSSARPICEMDILLSKSTTIPTTCTTTTFPAEIQTFQPLGNNKWLYILTKDTHCVLQCLNEISNHKLQGSGIINLTEGCKLHTGYSTLSAYQSSEDNVTYPVIVPDIRTEDCFVIPEDIKTPTLLPIAINDVPLDALKTIKNHLDTYSQELQNLRSKSASQRFLENNRTSFSWFYFILGIFMLTFLLLKLFSRWYRFTQCTNERGCIQIFNNCFDNSSRRRSSQISIPMRTITHNTSCISEDEDEENTATRILPPSSQSLGANAQSLF